MGKNSLKVLALALLPAMMAVAVSCGKKDVHQTVVIWRVGEVELQRQGESARQIELQDIVKQGDRIVTKANSFAVLQIGDMATVRVQAESEIAFSNLNDPAAIEMALNKGQVLSKVDKLAKGQSYGVRMPTALAAVRGTEFSATYIPGRNVVAVKAGKVEVTLAGQTDAKTVTATVDAGKAVVIGEALTERPIEEQENNQIELVSIVPIVPAPQSKKKEEMLELNRTLDEQQKEIQKRIDESAAPKTLEEIKAKYERVDEIVLYTGKTMRGVILERGTRYKILTTDGIVYVPSTQIRNTRLAQ
jgi:hypothetical protein